MASETLSRSARREMRPLPPGWLPAPSIMITVHWVGSGAVRAGHEGGDQLVAVPAGQGGGIQLATPRRSLRAYGPGRPFRGHGEMVQRESFEEDAPLSGATTFICAPHWVSVRLPADRGHSPGTKEQTWVSVQVFS